MITLKKTIKILSVVLLILIILGGVAVRFSQPLFVGFLSKINSQLVTKLYPDYLSSVDAVYFDEIEVNERTVILKGGTYDSGLVVKKVDFEVSEKTLKVSVYKGILTEKITKGLNVTYDMDTADINEIVLCGANNATKVIWKR